MKVNANVRILIVLLIVCSAAGALQQVISDFRQIKRLPNYAANAAVVAASDATPREQAAAEFVCDGVADEATIQEALTRYNVVTLSAGIFVMSDQVQLTSGQALLGTPGLTVIHPSADGVSTGVQGLGTEGNMVEDIVVRDLILRKPNAGWLASSTGQIRLEWAKNCEISNIFRYGNKDEGGGAALSVTRVERCEFRNIHLDQGNDASHATCFVLLSRDCRFENISGRGIAEVIDFSSCYGMNVSKIRGADLAEEMLDIGNTSDCTFSDLICLGCKNLFVLKTEAESATTLPNWVSPDGTNRNTFTGFIGVYDEIGINFSAGGTASQKLNQNHFSIFILMASSSALSSASATRLTAGDGGNYQRNTKFSMFHIDGGAGQGINIQASAYLDLVVADGSIRADSLCFNDATTVNQDMRAGLSFSNVVMQSDDNDYACRVNHRYKASMINFTCVNGGLDMRDPADTFIQNLRIINARNLAINIHWDGNDTDFWPQHDNRVDLHFDGVDIENNLVSTAGNNGILMFDDSSGGLGTIKGVSFNRVTVRDTQVTPTSGGLRWVGTYGDSKFTNSHIGPELNNTRDLWIPGATNRNVGNTGAALSEAYGEQAITEANTSAVVASGVSGVAPKHVTLTPTDDLGDSTKYWVESNATDGSFEIHVSPAPGGGNTATFRWSVNRVEA